MEERETAKTQATSSKPGGCLSKLLLFMFSSLLALGLCGIGFFIGSSVNLAKESWTDMPMMKGKPAIAVLELNGVIVSHSSDRSKEQIISEDLIKFLEKIREKERVKGILMIVNSPGGSAVASDEIYRELMEIREDKPVVCYLRDIAASGGYYISSACNYIVASPNSIVGNIGVILSYITVKGTLDKLGMKPVVLTSRPHKDIISPFRSPTEEEKKLIYDVLNDTHEVFLNSVYKGRSGKISLETLQQIADGRFFTGRQAEKLGLIDKVGTLKDAEAKLKELAKLPDKYDEIKYKPLRKPLLRELIGDFLPINNIGTLWEELKPWPVLYYR